MPTWLLNIWGRMFKHQYRRALQAENGRNGAPVLELGLMPTQPMQHNFPLRKLSLQANSRCSYSLGVRRSVNLLHGP